MKKIFTLIMCSLFISMSFPIQFVMAQTQPDNVRVEHLLMSKKLAKKAPVDVVNISSNQVQILSYNILELAFTESFNSKKASVGDNIVFALNDGLKTKEGTEILPPGTKFIAEITEVTKPKAFNKSGKIYLKFNYIEYPSGEQQDINAKIFSKKEFLSRGKLNALGKGLGSTLGGMAVGTAAGCCIGIAASAVIVGGFAIGMPVGFAVGAAAGLMTPGLYYKAKAGDKVNIQLVEDLYIKK